MGSNQSLKLLIQSKISEKIPDAFRPPKASRSSLTRTGIEEIDSSLGGFPHGELTEIWGGLTCGVTTLALSFLAEITQKQQLAAFVDVSDSLDIESCCLAGIDLNRLLWIRCGGEEEAKRNGQQGSRPALQKNESAPVSSRHPREATRGLEKALRGLLRKCPSQLNVRTEGLPSVHQDSGRSSFLDPRAPALSTIDRSQNQTQKQSQGSRRFRELNQRQAKKETWKRLEEALKVTDLLLHDQGFGAVVLDLAGVPASFSRRIPMASWFRFSRTVHGSPTALVLLSRQTCSQSAASLGLGCHCLSEQWVKSGPENTGVSVSTFGGLKFEVNLNRHRAQFLSPLDETQYPARNIRWGVGFGWLGTLPEQRNHFK